MSDSERPVFGRDTEPPTAKADKLRKQWRESQRRERARYKEPPIGWIDPDAKPLGLGMRRGTRSVKGGES